MSTTIRGTPGWAVGSHAAAQPMHSTDSASARRAGPPRPRHGRATQRPPRTTSCALVSTRARERPWRAPQASRARLSVILGGGSGVGGLWPRAEADLQRRSAWQAALSLLSSRAPCCRWRARLARSSSAVSAREKRLSDRVSHERVGWHSRSQPASWTADGSTDRSGRRAVGSVGRWEPTAASTSRRRRQDGRSRGRAELVHS